MNCSYNKLVENVLVLQCNNTEIYTNQNNEQISLNGVIVFFAARDIEIGEELMYDYGKNIVINYKSLTTDMFFMKEYINDFNITIYIMNVIAYKNDLINKNINRKKLNIKYWKIIN